MYDNLTYSIKPEEVVNFKPHAPFHLECMDNRNAEILWNVTLTILNAEQENEKELRRVIDRMYLKENLKFSDISSLTLEDLEYLDIEDADNILKNTKNLGNQSVTYESLMASPKSQEYNTKILQGCANHLKAMHELLHITEQKLFVTAPANNVLGEKSYASRFVLEALNELSQAAEEMDAKLHQLEELCVKPLKDEQKASSTNWRAKVGKIVLLTGLVGALGLIGSKLRF